MPLETKCLFNLKQKFLFLGVGSINLEAVNYILSLCHSCSWVHPGKYLSPVLIVGMTFKHFIVPFGVEMFSTFFQIQIKDNKHMRNKSIRVVFRIALLVHSVMKLPPFSYSYFITDTDWIGKLLLSKQM